MSLRPGQDEPPDEAFARLVQPYLAELVRVARRRLHDDDLAWEAVQDALLNLWDRGEAPEHPRNWLIRAVMFRSLHLRRTLRRRRLHEGRATPTRIESGPRDDPSHRIAIEELRVEVRAALERLGDGHREALELHLVEGLDYRGIADRLGVPIGTVRSRLARARAALRDVLEPGMEEF